MDPSYKDCSVDEVTMGALFSTKLKPSGRSKLVIVAHLSG